MGFLGRLLGNEKELDAHLNKGAIIVDVRTPGEFAGGHIEGSRNIPLNQIEAKKNTLKELNKSIILCCASGIRSGQAAKLLKAEGIDCVNGGSWIAVRNAIKEYKLL